jgi:hypothetical protein
MLFFIHLINGFYESYRPSYFWWRTIIFGEWNFEINKEGENVKISKLIAPKWNVLLRISIVFGIQFLTKLILFLAGLFLILNNGEIIEIIKDCLAMVFIMENDEAIFAYMHYRNSDFKKLWEDCNWQESILVSHIKKCTNQHSIKYKWKHFRGSMFLPLFIILFGIGIIKLIEFFL